MQGSDVFPNTSSTSVVIFGGDGFCGWPTALRFAAFDAKVTIIDNGARRGIDTALGTASLTKIQSLSDRVAAWAEMTGDQIAIQQIDIAQDYAALVNVLRDAQPDIVVHFAEQRSAPYSMMSSEGARHSVDNNIRATHNLLAALVETGIDPHLLHIGTIGVYGYGGAGLRLPEGYIRVTAHGADGRAVEKEILYPGEPESVYHLTKVLDQQLLAFYARHYQLRITDLHQGVVWGTQTAETQRDLRLVNRFDHDAIYGTVVNRFLVQAFEGRPLTVYGNGHQNRAFIHIEDVLSCISLAAATPPGRGEPLRVLNQFSEISSINALAKRIADLTGADIAHVDNPRQEPEGSELDADHTTLRGLGFTPRLFADTLSTEISSLAKVLKQAPTEVSEPPGRHALS